MGMDHHATDADSPAGKRQDNSVQDEAARIVAYESAYDISVDEPASAQLPGAARGVGTAVPPTVASDQPDTVIAAETREDDFDPVDALTRLIVGGGIVGLDELLNRLQAYQMAIRAEAEAAGSGDGETAVETDADRLRYMLIGFLFETEERVRRTLPLFARLADISITMTNKATQPLTDNRLTRPFTRPLQQRYERLVQRGESSLQRWIDRGREIEPPSRQLALSTYEGIIDEFISRLADNPEVQGLVTQQSIGLATEVRNEVRERTVSADNAVESIMRRILRRPPREELPPPPPSIQEWAGRALIDMQDEQDEQDDSRP